MTTLDASTVLLVEVEADAAEELTSALADCSVTVWHAESAADARVILRQRRPDLIIVDLSLPDVDGLVFCAHLATEAPGVPFMVCSAGTTAEKVLSFKLGAEDFVSRPYEIAELQARVEAILRRRGRGAQTRGALGDVAAGGSAPSAPVPELGRLRVDLARWRVLVDDKPLELTPTEFQLLVFMARHPGEILSREGLARGVWGNESMSQSRTIDAYVRRISSKLASALGTAHDDWPPRILNIRGLGYQLSVPHTREPRAA